MQSEEKLKQLLAITNIPIEHVKKHGYIKCVESIPLGETYTFSKEGYLMMVNLGKQDTEVPIILFEDGEDELPSVTPQEPTTKNDLEVLRDILVGFKQGVDSIRALPSVTPQESRWIPVSERLPEAGEYIGNVERYYLVQNEYGDMLVARYTHSGCWEQIYQLKPIGDEIVAWMPLPKPYESQESEDKE